MKVKQFVKEIFAQMKRDWYMPVTEHQIYDTTERVIGTYMGKPLYRKTISGITTPSAANTETDVYTVPDAEYIVSINGRTDVGVQTNMYHAPAVFMSTWASGAIIKMIAAGWLNLPIIITVEYTKTTDTASESKVPFEPLTEYSTEERMIGYWIDGKPLYRKVWSDLTIPSGNNDTTIPLGDQNIDMIVRVSTSSKMGAIENPPLSYDTGGNNQALQVFIGTGGSLFVRMRGTALSQYTGKKISVILEYTKTTD